VSHDPFFQNVVLLFDMPILYLFALKIKRYTPSQGKWSMFYIPPRQFESKTCVYELMIITVKTSLEYRGKFIEGRKTTQRPIVNNDED
jgi:hypothetical protein